MALIPRTTGPHPGAPGVEWQPVEWQPVEWQPVEWQPKARAHLRNIDDYTRVPVRRRMAAHRLERFSFRPLFY